MAARRRGPVLLELIRETQRSSSGAPAPSAERAPKPPRRERPAREPRAPRTSIFSSFRSSEDDGAAGWFSPGRVLRVPVGYLYFAAAGITALFVIGWALGHRQATVSHRAQLAAQAEESLGASNDPLLADPSLNRPGLVRTQTPQTQAQTRQQTPPGPPTGASPERRPTPSQGVDTRIPGQNYFIVAREDQATARRAAEFLSSQGVAAIAIPDNNPRFHMVVVTARGFPREEMNSADYRQLRDELRRLGVIWKRDHRGPSDFSDLYPSLHRP